MNSTSSKSYDIPKLMSLICTPLLVVAGVILNFLTIMVFCRRKMRKYTLSTSMISLAITDIAVLTIPVFLTWVDELFFEFYYLSNTIWCNLHSYLDLVFCGSSAWIIILVSIERWFAVCKPWHKSKYFTNNRVLFAIIFIYILAITCFIYFPFVIDRDRKKQICVLRSNKVYSILGTISIILVYVIPFLTLAVLNSMIILRLRMRPFANTHVISSINSTSTYSNNNNNNNNYNNNSNNSNNNSSFKVNYTNNATNNNNSNNSNNNSVTNNTLVTLLQTNMSNNDRNLSITLVTVAATYMILTFPFQVFWLYSYFVEYFFNNNNDEQFNYSNSTNLFLNNTNSKIETDYTTDSHSMSFNWSSTRFYLIDITFTIRNTNYMINFFLYSAVSKLFRQEFLALITEKENIFIRILCFLCFRKSSNKQDKSRKLSSIRLKSYYDTNNYTTKRTSFTYKTDNTPCTNTTNNELSKANPSRQGSARQKFIKKNSCEEFQIQDLQQSEQIVALIDNDNSLINTKSTKTSATQTKYSSITIARKLDQINKNKNIVKT